MTKRKAIQILNKQKDKLLDESIYKDENWVFQTASYVKDFLGEDSPEYNLISRFHFGILTNGSLSNEEIHNELDSKKQKAEVFIDNCIETIKNKGLYKSSIITTTYIAAKSAIIKQIVIGIIITIVGGLILYKLTN